MGIPSEGAWNVPNHKFGHSDKDPIWPPICVWVSWVSTIDHGTYTFCGLWELSSDTQPPRLAAQVVMLGALPDISHHCSTLAWDQHLPVHLQMPPLTGTWARCSLYSLPSHKLPLSVRNLRVTLQTLWGGLPRAWNCGKTQICVSDSFRGCSLAHDTRVTQEASLLTEIAQMGTLHNPLGTAPQTKSPGFLRRESFSKLPAWNSSSGQGTNFLKFPQMWPLIVRHTHAFCLIDYTNNYSSNNSNKSGSRTVCQALG